MMKIDFIDHLFKNVRLEYQIMKARFELTTFRL